MILYKALNLFINTVEILIFIRVILSWFNFGYNSVVIRFVYDMTEPILYPAKFFLDEIGINKGMIDFSPLVTILFLNIIKDVVLKFFIKLY